MAAVTDTVVIVVNAQEKSLLDTLRERTIEIAIERESSREIDIGDVVIKKNGRLRYIIERKSKSDLLASIKDGRYDDQKGRMAKSGLPLRNCVILVEDITMPSHGSKEWKMVWSAITNSFHRDGFTVMMTRSVIESADYIHGLAYSLQRYEAKNIDEVSALADKVASCSIKKSKVTASNYLVKSLTIIPGVGEAMAEAIVEAYPTKGEIIAAGWERLSDVKYGHISDNKRRIGYKKANLIITMILGEALP